MIEATLKLDTDEMAQKAVSIIERNIEDSEIMESLTDEQKINLNTILYYAVLSSLEEFETLNLAVA